MATDRPPSETEPAPARPSSDALHFDGFVILPGERRLLVAGEPVKIGGRAFDLLLVLVGARDRVLGKNELLERVWPGLVVEENNLSVHVSQLRKWCGPHSISTVPGRGYQFTATGTSAWHDAKGAARREDPEGEAGVGAHVRSGNLPAQQPPLIGREQELAEVGRLLQAHRWLTITGAGGMGKTRLAETAGQQEAARLPVWLVELASVTDPRFVPPAVAQALGASIVDVEHPLDVIVATLRGRPGLLILDNCEHLIQAVSPMCVRLLRELPDLRLLVTSQERLHGVDERVYQLGPMSLPDPSNAAAALQAGSIRLLRERVRALSQNFDIDSGSVDDAAAICRQLDGLPLAIELAAGRIPMLGLAGVRARLGELFRLLTGDSRARLRRHQTLRAALDWSYQLLSPFEQALLRRLGAFAGSFSVEGVQQIAHDLNAQEWDVLDGLASLIDKSLVQIKGQQRPRYVMLETTRIYALEQLAACAETEDALARHARATRTVCSLAARRRDTSAIWEETANIRAACAWALRSADAELVIGLVVDSSAVLALGGLVGEVLQRLIEVEACVSDDLPRALVAKYWQWLGRFGSDGRMPARRCIAALRRAEAIYRQLANDRHVHACLRMRAEAHIDLGELELASQAIDAARQLEAHNGSLADRMRRFRIEGKLLERRGDGDAAIERLERALELALLEDIHRYVATLTQDIGQCLLNAGDAAAAEQRFRAVLGDARRDLSVALAVAYARIGLASALVAQGRLTPACTTALEAVPLLCSCGILLAHAEVFAWLFAALGQRPLVAVLLATAEAFRRVSQTTRGPIQMKAFDAAAAALGRATASEQPDGLAIESDRELARLLTAALSAHLLAAKPVDDQPSCASVD